MILLIFLLCFSFFSCRYIKEIPSAIKVINYALKDQKMSKKTSETFIYQKDKFIFKDQSVFIPCIINGKPDTVLYDSGFSGYLKERVTHDSVFKKTIKLKSNTMAFSKPITFIQGLKYYDIQSPWFNFHNYVGEMRYVSTDTLTKSILCDTNIKRKSNITLGFKCIPHYDQVLMLNFSDTTIALYDSTIKYETRDYIRINATFWDKK